MVNCVSSVPPIASATIQIPFLRANYMDYLNPKKQLQHKIILYVGYVLIAFGIIIGTIILLYEAYGFGLGKNGTVIQNGLVFVSSQPNPANIYLNGQLDKNATTNTRLLLLAGIYNIELTRAGYYAWDRSVNVMGGAVMHFDYPLLIPKKLVTTKYASYPSQPGLVTQSPDRNWLLVQAPGSESQFDLYDLKNPQNKPTVLTIPSSILSKATTSESWQLDQWSDDNQHVILEHVYDGKTEYIMLDRTDPSASINLNNLLGTSPTDLTLNNLSYNQFYLYNAATQEIDTASISAPTSVPYISHVLAYKSYGTNTMLYVTTDNAPSGKVLVKLTEGNQTYIIHTFASGTNYLVDLTEYSGKLYVVAGASSENKVYIFKDPVGQLSAQPNHAVAPIQVFHVDDPTYDSFSDNTQFIMVEGGNEFGVYDLDNKVGYNYVTKQPIDSPQVHATWMDGDRLTYVSNGKLIMFDYDDTNVRTLVSMNPAYLPIFNATYRVVYAVKDPDTTGQVEITQTSLLTPADQ